MDDKELIPADSLRSVLYTGISCRKVGSFVTLSGASITKSTLKCNGSKTLHKKVWGRGIPRITPGELVEDFVPA